MAAGAPVRDRAGRCTSGRLGVIASVVPTCTLFATGARPQAGLRLQIPAPFHDFQRVLPVAHA